MSITSFSYFDMSCATSKNIFSDDSNNSMETINQFQRLAALRDVPIEQALPFDRVIQFAHELVDPTGGKVQLQPRKPPPFDVNKWDQRTTGGLQDNDRIFLARLYGTANSVFEYGLGESTYIANAVKVPRYAGIDSDAEWVALARDKVASHFRFYFADIGKTVAWGHPADPKLAKNILHYQLMPLIVEEQPFDVYMADGRWRVPCMIVSFLHASTRGGDPSKTIVLLHDCFRKEHWDAKQGDFPKHLDNRPEYTSADHLLDLVQHSGSRLCVYQRKPDTTDEQLYEFWMANHDVIG